MDDNQVKAPSSPGRIQPIHDEVDVGHQPPKEYPTHPHKHVTSPVHEAARFVLWALFWAGISVELIAYFMYKGEWGDRMDHYRPQRFGLSDGSILWPGKAKLFRIHLACAGLVAAACAAVLLDELLRRKAHPDEDLMYSVGRALTYRLKVAGCCCKRTVHWWLGPDISVIGILMMLLVVACICTWHVLGVSSELRKRNGDDGPKGQAVGWKVWNGQSHAFGPHRVLKSHALWFGLDAMIPLSLIGIPACRVSALFRAIGAPYEAAIAYHRWLGHLLVLLISLHGAGPCRNQIYGAFVCSIAWRCRFLIARHTGVLYMCAWILIGGKSYVGPNGNAWNKHGNRNLWDEVLMGCHKGERVTKEGSTGYTIPGGFSRTFRNDCNGVNNFWGVLAWLIALTMWAFALPWARRWSYDIFIGVHQLHWGFWFFSCAHYNTIVSYAMPSMAFYLADLVHRRYRTTWPTECGLKAHLGADGAMMTTVSVPLPPARKPSKCPMASYACTVPDDAAAAVIHLKSNGLSLVRRKPFTVAGSFYGTDGRRFGLVHVFDAGGSGAPVKHQCHKSNWTRRLGELAERQGHAPLILRGPLPHPNMEYDLARDAAKGKATLVIGAGSGQTPGIAFLRKVREFRTVHLAHGGQVDEQATCVRFVLVVRDEVLLECCEGWMLPRDAEGTTGAAWLKTEIHVTRQSGRDRPIKDIGAMPTLDADYRGPVEVHRAPSGELVGVGSNWPEPPAPKSDEEKKWYDAEDGQVREQTGKHASFTVDEAVALVGAFLGYLFCAQILLYGERNDGKDQGPLSEEYHKSFFQPKRSGNPNFVSGGLAFVFCCIAAMVIAIAFLFVSDVMRWLARPKPEELAKEARVVHPINEDAGVVRIHLQGDGKRPDLEDVVARADAELGADAHVLGGGPQFLLETLNDHLGPRFVHRLTYSM